MKTTEEVKTAFDQLDPQERAAVLESARLAEAVNAWNEISRKAYQAGKLAPSNPETAH